MNTSTTTSASTTSASTTSTTSTIASTSALTSVYYYILEGSESMACISNTTYCIPLAELSDFASSHGWNLILIDTPDDMNLNGNPIVW